MNNYGPSLIHNEVVYIFRTIMGWIYSMHAEYKANFFKFNTFLDYKCVCASLMILFCVNSVFCDPPLLVPTSLPRPLITEILQKYD